MALEKEFEGGQERERGGAQKGCGEWRKGGSRGDSNLQGEEGVGVGGGFGNRCENWRERYYGMGRWAARNGNGGSARKMMPIIWGGDRW